jgi:hypothetical protein
MRFGNSGVTLVPEMVTTVETLIGRGFSRVCGANLKHGHDASFGRGILRRDR